MMRYCFPLLAIGALLTSPVEAQQNAVLPTNTLEVYSIRVNHKWGFVKFYATLVDTVVAPRYDYIADINLPWNTYLTDTNTLSPYKVFELDGKVGLLDNALQEIIPNRYKRIRALTDRYFAVEIDHRFQLIDKQGNILLNSAHYDDICPADVTPNGEVNYFFVKKGNRWGIHSKDNSAVFEPKYTVLLPAGKKGYFKAKTQLDDVNWQLVNAHGQLIFKEVYRDIQVLDEHWIAVKAGFWKLLQRKSHNQLFVAGKKNYSEVKKVNDYFAILIPNDTPRIQLWHIPNQKLIKSEAISSEIQPTKERPRKTYLPWYEPLDDQHGIYTPTFSYSKLITNEGKVFPTPFNEISAADVPGIYRVNYRGDWGMLAPAMDSLPIVPCFYDEIMPLQHHIAICRKGSKYGAYLIKNGQVDSLLCIYDYLTLLDSTHLWVPSEENIIQYRVSEQGKFVLDTIIPSVFAVAQNTQKANVEAPAIAMQALPSYHPPRLKSDNIQLKPAGDSIMIIKMDTVRISRIETQFIPIWKKKFVLPHQVTLGREVVHNSILALYYADQLLNNDFTQMLSKGTLQSVDFYDVMQANYATQLHMTGFRAFDSLSTHTVFIDSMGQMGLINRRGEQLTKANKPIRYTYIGPFIAGRARVCIGGKLMVDEDGKLAIPAKFMLSELQDFIKEFNIQETRASIYTRGTKGIFAIGTEHNPCTWAYINTDGEVILKPEADYVDNFHPHDETAFLYKTNKKQLLEKPDADFGVINKDGKLVLPMQYSNIVRDEDYFMIGLDSTPTFYFNKKGHQIFENPTRLRPFSEGLAQFSDANNRWGYVDTNGVIVIGPQFKMARPFSEGLALVVDSTGSILFINTIGNIAFRTTFKERDWRGIGDFRGGRCWHKKSGKAWVWGCYNKNGETIIPAIFQYTPKGASNQMDEANLLPMDFSHGVAAVIALDSNGRSTAGIIDTSGNLLPLSSHFYHIDRFDENGYASFTTTKGGVKGVLNHQAKIIVSPQYHQIKHFINGYAKVGNNRGGWGLINQQGKEVLPVMYAEIDTVAEGLVAVKSLGSNFWTVIDTNNQVRIKGAFDRVKPFKNGLTFVTTRDRSKILNANGEEINLSSGNPIFFSEGLFGMNESSKDPNKPKRFFYADASGNNLFGRYFAEIGEHQLGVAKVSQESTPRDSRKLLGAINTHGVSIVPLKYNNLHIQPDGNIIINPQRLFGLADKTGKILLEPAYDRISRFNEAGIFRVERGEKVGYLRLKADKLEWLWALAN